MHRVSRRAVFAGGLAAGASLGWAASGLAADQAEQPLRDLARARGLQYGSAATASQLLTRDCFTDLLTREVAVLAPENEMKWSHVSTEPFQADYRVADFFIDFATAHGLLCRGHNLLWFYSTPEWFKELRDRGTARAAMLHHVADMVGRYRGRIDSWDVVNEPVNPLDDRVDHLRTAVFLQQVGPEYLELVHFEARAADPKARLVLNEYDVEYDTPYHDRSP